jgi:hypothetical protein
MITFTVPPQLRGLFWDNQKVAYNLLLNCKAALVPIPYSTPMPKISITIPICI